MNHVETFIRSHFSDAQVIQLQDDLIAGRFEFRSCCCLTGRPTNHGAIHPFRVGFETEPHFIAGRQLPGAAEAEWELPCNDAAIVAYLLPICEAEITRREIPESGAMGDEMEEFFAKLEVAG